MCAGLSQSRVWDASVIIRNLMRPAWGAILVLMLCACDVRIEKSASPAKIERSRIFPPGQGKVVHFDLLPRTDAPVLISSKDVEAQRDGRDLVVNFDTIDFARNASRGTDLEVNKLEIKIYKPNGLQSRAESEKYDVHSRKLTAAEPLAHASRVQLKIRDAGAECEEGCLLAASVGYYSSFSSSEALGGLMKTELKTGSSTESERAEIRLKEGRAATRAAAKNAPSETCSLLSEAEATQLLGQKTIFRNEVPTAGYCRLGPDPYGSYPLGMLWIDYKIDHDTASYKEFVERPDAEVVAGLGDRAVWNEGALLVVLGNKRLILQIRDSKVPSVLTPADLQKKAIAVARKIVAKL
jgi:hypothetical protein